jgi:hypothetical protein
MAEWGMQIEIFTLCHSAIMEKSSISLLRTADSFQAEKLPGTIKADIALRARFFSGEAGKYKISISVIDPSGEVILKAPDCMTSVSPTPERSRTHSMVFSNAKFSVEVEGTYWLQVAFGNYEPFRVPFRVTRKKCEPEFEAIQF